MTDWSKPVAEEIAAAFLPTIGLGDAERRLISFRQNAIFLLPDESLSLRIYGPNQLTNRAGLMTSAAAYLARHDFPAVRLAAIGPAPPVLFQGYRLSLWHWLEKDAERPNIAAPLGALLRRFHDLPPPEGKSFPEFDPAEKVLSRLAMLRGGDALTAKECDLLQDRLDAALDTLARSTGPSLGLGLIHGDAIPGNFLFSGGELVMLDMDSASHGPREWDLAPMAAVTKRFWRDDATYDRFLAGYGAPHAVRPRIEAAAAVKLLTITTYLCLSAGQSPTIDAEIQNRMRFWASGDDSQAWTTGFAAH